MVNPRVFFDVDVEGQRIGRIIMELFANECPVTTENFRALCTGERGMSKISSVPLHYRGSIFHRVIKGFMIQGGDFTRRDGTGGETIFGPSLQDESFKRKHDIEGLLSMANKGPNTSTSQFFITTRPTPHLDGKHVVFGRVVKGYDVIEKIENMPTDDRDRPLSIVMISNCGELELRLPATLLEQKKLKEQAEKKESRSKRRSRSSSRSGTSGSESGGDSSSSSDSDSDTSLDRQKRKNKSSGHESHTSRGRNGAHGSSRDSRHRHSSNQDRGRERDRSRDRDERSSKRSRKHSRSHSHEFKKSHADQRRGDEPGSSRGYAYAKSDTDHSKADLKCYSDKVHKKGEPSSGCEIRRLNVQELAESDLRHSLNAVKEARHHLHPRSRSQSPEIRYKGRGRMKYRERRLW